MERLIRKGLVPLLTLLLAGPLASSSMAAEQAAKGVDAAETLLVRPHSPVIGPKSAPVTIVEFFDPSCEACRAWFPIVKMIMAEYPNDVRLVIRYLALHQGSDEAIRIVEAGRAQGKFIPVLEAVLERQPEWHDGNLAPAWSAAESAGLNAAKARTSLRSRKLTAALAQDQADREQLGVRGTPTFFVNGKMLSGPTPQTLYQIVRAEVEAVQSSRPEAPVSEQSDQPAK